MLAAFVHGIFNYLICNCLKIKYLTTTIFFTNPMKSIETIKKMLQHKEILTVRQTLLVKGGDDTTTALDDNKRPERPGGGVSTH
jgi:hypothetical protein